MSTTCTLEPLRDGWILSGEVELAEGTAVLPLEVRVDGQAVGTALASDPRPAPPGRTRLRFEFPLHHTLFGPATRRLEVWRPAAKPALGAMEAVIQQRRHYRDLPGFLAWSFHHRVVSAPFTEADRLCLAHFDAVADRLAQRPVVVPAGRPLVSVVMPCHNAAATLAAAIASVLAQQLASFELIVVDDGSEDETTTLLDAIADPRLICLRLPRRSGPSQARNVALAQARGDLVAYLDADNRWDPRFLAAMAARLQEDPGRQAAFCGQYLFHPGATMPFAARLGAFNPALADNESIIDINCLVHRRTALATSGGFAPALRRLEDWDFVLRLTAAEAPAHLPSCLSHYVARPESPSQRGERESAWQVITRRDGSAVEIARGGDGGGPPADGVSIVIPSFEVPEILRACVARVRATVDLDRVEVIICDNASSPETQACLSELVASEPRLRLDLAEENGGFTRAANRGIALAKPGNHVVLLNNDALVAPGWLEAMLAVPRLEPDVGIVVPRQLLAPATPTVAIHAPAANIHLDADVSLSAHHGNVLPRLPGHPLGLVELSFAPFFCVLLTRPLLDALGPLDERRGRHYGSDALYCLAARELAGLRIIYTPRARVHHLLQRASRALRVADAAAGTMMLDANRWPGQRELWE
jgi:glycosyltransferase involved in cell wall biosynthesis